LKQVKFNLSQYWLEFEWGREEGIIRFLPDLPTQNFGDLHALVELAVAFSSSKIVSLL